MLAVGIDLGTTNSLIAVIEGDSPKLIPNSLGHTLTPSTVGLDEEGRVLVGEEARHRLVTHPELTAARFKRYMGTEHVFDLGGQKYRAEELSALVLKSLKDDAEKYLGQAITDVVVSVPAYFDDNQRKATIAAAEIAGLKVSRLINEPTAAAIAHGVHNKTDESTFIVLDLGGGTFDVSILEMFDGVMEVRSSAGDAFLGGEDFTDALARDFAIQAGYEWNDLSPRRMADIYELAERAKIQLGSEHDVTVVLSVDGERKELKVDRESFEEICAPILLKLRRPIERAMYDTSLKVDEIDKLILVGGATRMSAMRSLASKLFRRLPEKDIDPDTVVALGAAVQAGLNQKHKALEDVVMTDICPFTLGIETATRSGKNIEDGLFSPIIERNTVVPVSKVETYHTMEDKQKAILLKVFQGEAPKVIDNVFLGQIEVPVPKNSAGEEVVDVRFTYDPSGILEVGITVKSTGKETVFIIEKTPGKMSDAEIASKIKALESLKKHPREDAVNRTLLARLGKAYEMTLGEDRGYIGELLKKFELCLTRQDAAEISRVHGEITRVLDRIEEQYVF
ncbi:MAG: Hsp70 family protein [Methyloligellaceae bacterium]